MGSTYKLEFSNQVDNLNNMNQGQPYELKLDNGVKVIIKKYDNDSFTMLLPSGETLLYTISPNSEITQLPSIKINDQNNVIQLNNFGIGLIFFTLIVQLVMLFDDLKNLSAFKRLTLQSLCVLGLIIVSGVYIKSLGNLLGFGEINLGYFGIPFTVFCVVGIMNAFNMIDGLNGLCASICLICFSAIIFMMNANNIPSLFPLILPVGAICGFLMYNMGLLGEQRTVFLGDNGSNALGFMCAWILIYFSSNIENSFAPVTALWFVAIPFFDAVRVMIYRLLEGIKVFNAGREHIHHKLFDAGFSNTYIYLILMSISVIFVVIGIIFNNFFPINHYYSFYAFLIFWACYYLSTKLIKKNV